MCWSRFPIFFLFLTKNSFSYKYSFAKVLALMSLSFHHDLATPEQESNSFMFTTNQVRNSLQSLQSGILGSRRKSVQVAFCHFQKAEQAASLEVKKREEGGGEMEVVQRRKREKKEKVHISSSSSTFFLSCSPTCPAAKSKAVGENCFLLKRKKSHPICSESTNSKTRK